MNPARAQARKGSRPGGVAPSARRSAQFFPRASSRERPVPFSPQSVTLLNVDKLGVFESREQLNKLSHVVTLSEPISDEGPLLGETYNAFLDLGLHTMELRLQFSQVFHLAHRESQGPALNR